MDTATNMLAGGSLGFVFRQWAEARKERHAQMMALADRREESMEKASARGGTWVRRILIGIVATAFVSAVVAGFLNKEVILEYELHRKILFFEWEKMKHVAVNGVVILKENRDAFESMIGFYFGQAIK